LCDRLSRPVIGAQRNALILQQVDEEGGVADAIGSLHVEIPRGEDSGARVTGGRGSGWATRAPVKAEVPIKLGRIDWYHAVSWKKRELEA